MSEGPSIFNRKCEVVDSYGSNWKFAEELIPIGFLWPTETDLADPY